MTPDTSAHGSPSSALNEDVVLSVRNVSKCFEMYEKPVHRLYQTLCAGHKKFYKEFWALKDISFDVHRGECVGIIGRNGAGKSTLLQIITGTLAPTSGEVKTKGRVAALLELGSGFNPEFTGRENVYLNGAILGLTREEIDRRYDDILAFADIGEFINQPVKTYSSGMMVRLAFAVIAHVDADILIVDEALSVGDAFFQQKCMRFMRGFMKEHTVLFVSHDTGAVVNFCKHGILLEHGQMKMVGMAKHVVQQYLQDIYSEQQRTDVVQGVSEPVHVEKLMIRDERSEMLMHSNLRNDLEIFTFDPNAKSFGAGGATIFSVEMLDSQERMLSWVVGCEDVELIVRCRANKDLYSPIVGFIVRDRLGQNLFGDNTYLTYADKPISVKSGERFVARFGFRLPFFPQGDFSICVAVAEGTQQQHVQHQWMNDALLFKSHSAHFSSGVVGIPMRSIRIMAEGDVA